MLITSKLNKQTIKTKYLRLFPSICKFKVSQVTTRVNVFQKASELRILRRESKFKKRLNVLYKKSSGTRWLPPLGYKLCVHDTPSLGSMKWKQKRWLEVSFLYSRQNSNNNFKLLDKSDQSKTFLTWRTFIQKTSYTLPYRGMMCIILILATIRIMLLYHNSKIRNQNL